MVPEEAELPTVQGGHIGQQQEEKGFDFSNRILYMSAVTVIERELDLDRCVPPAVLAREGKECLGNDLPTVSEINSVADKPIQLANDAELGIPSEDLREFLDVVKGQDQKGGKRRRRQRGGDQDDEALAEYTPRQRAVATGILMSCGIAGGAWAMGGLEVSALGAFGSLEKLLVATKMAVPPCREKSAIDRTLQDKAMASVGMPATTSCSAIGDEYEQALKRMWATSVGLLAVGGLTWRKAWKKLQLSVLRRLGAVSERFMTPSQIEAQLRSKEEQEQKLKLGTQRRKMEFERNLVREELKHKKEMALMKRDMESLERGEVPPTPQRAPSGSAEQAEVEEPKTAAKGKTAKGKGKGKAAPPRAESPPPVAERRSLRSQRSRDPSPEERGQPSAVQQEPPASPRASERGQSGYRDQAPPSDYSDPQYDMQGYADRGYEGYGDEYGYGRGYGDEYGDQYAYPEDLGDEGPAMPRGQSAAPASPPQTLRRSARNRGKGGRKTRKGRVARRTRKAGAAKRKARRTRKTGGKRKVVSKAKRHTRRH